MFIIKFLIYFLISFVILCVPIKNSTLFYYLERHAVPVTKKIFSYVRTNVKKGLQDGQRASKKFFTNSTPEASDSIKSRYSSTKKKKAPLKIKNVYKESYTPEERAILKKILESNK